jgi:hypothetical protein
VTGKRAAMGIGVGEEELDDEVAEKIAGLLLLRLVPAEAREAAGNAGKQRRPWRWSAGTASPASSNGEEGNQERMSARERGVV